MKKIINKALKICLWVVLFYFGSTLFFGILYRFVNPIVTPLMVIRSVEQVLDNKPLKLRKSWRPLDKISPSMTLAVVASEDNRFLEHHGFDMEAIEKALDYNQKKQGKKVRGASTISQQTAKNVFLWPQRSWIRKGLEVYFTVLIEFVWGKKRIMEVYLNVAETGKGIYGVEMAAQQYFGKPASRLTRSESALLAAILPNPLKWNPANPTPYLRERKDWILWNMGNIGTVGF